MRGVPRLRPAMIAAATSASLQQSGRSTDDDRQVFRVIEVELADETESIAQRRGDESGPCRRATSVKLGRSNRMARADGPRRS